MITAKDLNRGQRAVVESIADDAVAVYLLERGVVPGEWLEVERVAPSGDPIAIRVSDHLLCLRKQEASSIRVKEELA